MVSQLNQDPRAESTANSGHGTIAMEEDFTDDSAMACKTPVAASMPVVAPAGDAVLSSPESPWNKKPCVHELMAERPLQSASTVIMEPDYNDAPLIGYKRPDLSEVIPWIRFKAQNMMEPPWQTEMASVKQDKNIRYIAVMFVWFRCWKVRSGS